MKTVSILFVLVMAMMQLSCSKKTFATNGETIYMTGRNQHGEKLIDNQNSRITIVSDCRSCHGKGGDRMGSVSIKSSFLSNSNNFSVPYNDRLFYRFLDHDLKSDGTKANIGVIWKMSDSDKKDLWDYLKTL